VIDCLRLRRNPWSWQALEQCSSSIAGLLRRTGTSAAVRYIDVFLNSLHTNIFFTHCDRAGRVSGMKSRGRVCLAILYSAECRSLSVFALRAFLSADAELPVFRRFCPSLSRPFRSSFFASASRTSLSLLPMTIASARAPLRVAVAAMEKPAARK